jgi:predicted amidohydrolase
MFEEILQNNPPETDIVILPEMFTTGFSMQVELFAETMDGKAFTWMKQLANKSKSAICGSFMAKENGFYFNRFLWIEPDGKFYTYDKAHLFRMGEEQKHFTKGNSQLLINYKGWKIAPFVCYDLRFPVWIRRRKDFNYDLLIFVANWPERRKMHWITLSKARAIENQSYLLAVNRVGEDGNSIYHSGDSMAVEPDGNVYYIREHEKDVAIIEVDKSKLNNYREIFPAGLDADEFYLK